VRYSLALGEMLGREHMPVFFFLCLWEVACQVCVRFLKIRKFRELRWVSESVGEHATHGVDEGKNLRFNGGNSGPESLAVGPCFSNSSEVTT